VLDELVDSLPPRATQLAVETTGVIFKGVRAAANTTPLLVGSIVS
jgi:hypothetical protein